MRNIIAILALAVLMVCGATAGYAAPPDAQVRYVITNGGVDVKGNGQVHYVAAGHHDGDVVAWADSGDVATLPAGAYDVHLTFSDGAATKDIWIDNQTFSGKVEKKVEIALPITEVRYVITNGGVDTKDQGQVHYFLAGRRDDTITWANSGDAARMAAGVYDVHVTFSDGSATKDIWIANQNFSGKVAKTVEVGVNVAEVRFVITNGGVDLKDKGQVHVVAAGHHDGDVVDWTNSGGTLRIAAGAYDVRATYMDGLINKQKWLDKQSFSGKVQRTVEMGVIPATPTVSVTEDGADVGNKAAVAYFDPASGNKFGEVSSGQPALLEQGTYDIQASFEGAEGQLQKVMLTGKPHLSIAVKKPVVEVLKIGGPPPKACTIEVYGVNFDFNKATLRSDSEPVLKQVLLLFTGAPSFGAEVSGHTDNVGTPPYNLKLSDARAAAVKAWLVSHGVAATRVTSRGYGDTKPLVPNTTDANRFKNRRVELQRQNCK